MNIAIIDYWANRGESFLHRATPLSKIIAVLLIIAAVVLAQDVYVLLIAYLSVLTLVVLARLPVLKIMAISAYPAIFAILFAISRWDGTWVTPAMILLKATTAAIAVVMMIFTTPYPRLFSIFGHLMPQLIVDGLFMTYRSLFILLELMSRLLRSLRLRGGLAPRHYLRNSTNLASALGVLLIRSFELSQRLYDVMRVRGYQGRLMADERHYIASGDWPVLALGLGILTLAAIMRYYRNIFVWYNGYLLLAALLALTVVVAVQQGRRLAWKK